MEFQDFEMRFYTHGGDFAPGSPLDRWCDELIAGITGAGFDPEPGAKLKGWVEDAGFANVTHRLLPIPTGTWPKDKKLKEIGAFDLVQFLEGLEAISLRTLTQLRGWTAEEVQVLLAKLREELKNPRMRLQHNMYVPRMSISRERVADSSPGMSCTRRSPCSDELGTKATMGYFQYFQRLAWNSGHVE